MNARENASINALSRACDAMAQLLMSAACQPSDTMNAQMRANLREAALKGFAALREATLIDPAVAIVAPAFMVPTEHEKNEWSRMARAAYAADQNDTGHKFSMAATLSKGQGTTLARFDALQAEYRAWLIDGTFPATPSR